MEKTIRKLLSYKNSSYPTLSVYLGVAGARDKKSSLKTMLMTQFHSLIHQLSSSEKKVFREDLRRIEEYLEDSFDTRGTRSVVFFTAGRNLWEVLSFEFYLPNLLKVSNSCYLSPLVDDVKRHKKYMVILVDRKKARFFIVYLGEIVEHEDVVDQAVPQNVRKIHEAWKRKDKIFCHIEEHLHRHFKMIASVAESLVRNNNDIHFIIIGGHEENIHKLKKHLSGALQKKVLGEFITELNIPLNDVLLESKRVAEMIEEKQNWKIKPIFVKELRGQLQ